jgi:hypothetical protein
VKLGEAGAWKHASAITGYNDAELASMLTWLKTALR